MLLKTKRSKVPGLFPFAYKMRTRDLEKYAYSRPRNTPTHWSKNRVLQRTVCKNLKDCKKSNNFGMTFFTISISMHMM